MGTAVESAERAATALAIVGRGAVDTAEPAGHSRNASSFFADPAAWLVLAAAEEALAGAQDEIDAAGVGVVVVSGHCTAHTMSALSAGAARGLVSPLRFAGANPGVLAGLPCIMLKLRGPSLVFTMDPAEGIGPATAVAAGWLRDGHAGHVLLAEYGRNRERHHARALLIRAARDGETDDRPAVAGLLSA